MGVLWKFQFLGGGSSRKTNIMEGDCLKRGLGQILDLRGVGLTKKRGDGVFEWCLYPNAHYVELIKPSHKFSSLVSLPFT